MAAAVAGMVAGDHDQADAGGPAGGDGALDAGAGRVVQPDQAEQLEVGLGLGRRRRPVTDRVGGPAGDGQDPQAARSPSRRRACCAPRCASRQRGRTESGAPFTNSGRRRSAPTTAGGSGRTGSGAAGVDVLVGRRVDRAGGRGRRSPPPSGRRPAPRPRRGGPPGPARRPPRRPPRPGPRLGARRGRRRPPRSGRSPRPRAGTYPAGVQTSTTVISLRVRVPVLSVQTNGGRAERLDRLEVADEGVAGRPCAGRPWPARA